MVISGHKAKSKVPMMLFKFKMEEDRCPEAITTSTPKYRGNNVFRSKETPKKVPRKIFRGLEVRKTVR